MNEDTPSIQVHEPFRLNGRLVQATGFTMTDAPSGGSFTLKGVVLYEPPTVMDAEWHTVPERLGLPAPARSYRFASVSKEPQ